MELLNKFVFVLFSVAAILMFINIYYVFKSSFGNSTDKEKADRKWKRNNWIVFYLIISGIVLFFAIGFLEVLQ